MEKHKLSEKAYNIQIISIVLTITYSLILLLISIHLEQEPLITSIILFLMFLPLIPILKLMVTQISRPKIVLEYDNEGLYINFTKSKIVYIKFRDILLVVDQKIRSRYKEYKSGTLIIETEDKKYKIGIIKEVAEAQKFIYKKIQWRYMSSSYLANHKSKKR